MIKNLDKEEFDLNVCYGEAGTPLHAACFTGQNNVVKFLLDNHYIDGELQFDLDLNFPNAQGLEAAEVARIHCYDEIVEMFVNLGLFVTNLTDGDLDYAHVIEHYDFIGKIGK